jgi:hypothetical protein
MFPKDDEQFEEVAVKSVARAITGWAIERADGWSFFVPEESPVEPKVGMVARFYGRGIGATVRGLFLDGSQVFYRTEAEDKEKQEVDTYGADAADWLKRWDEGLSVFSIEMGGLGPGYEQCIQITCAEILRHMLRKKYDANAWVDADSWRRDRDETEAAMFDNQTVVKLGLSGAQYGAAQSLASALYRDGPRTVMTNPTAADRHIQVSRNFPGSAA